MIKHYFRELSGTLLEWDKLAIKTGQVERRKWIWALADIECGLHRDPEPIIKELRTWKQTPEVLRYIDLVSKDVTIGLF